MHDYATPAIELVLIRSKMKPSGLICGHDYTHAAGSAYYERVESKDRGDAYNSYGVIEAVHEFLLFNPAWFFALKTSVTTDRAHTSFCLAQHANFPHERYAALRQACREAATVEADAATRSEPIDLAVHKPSF